MSVARRTESILVVEDEALVALDLTQALRTFGYDDVRTAVSADDAIRAATERRPDLVLMDIRIKGARDGIEAAHVLKRDFGCALVFMTAHSDPVTMARAAETRPDGYLTKPVQLAALRSTAEVAILRRRLDHHVREQERWHQRTLVSIADAVVSIDLAGNVLFMNTAAEALTGVTLAQAKGRPATEALALRDAQGDVLDAPLSRVLRTEQVVHLPSATLLNASTGAESMIADSAAPVLEGERMIGAVMVFRDVTETHQEQQRAELQGRLASLGTLAAGVAHEINNPLAAAVSNLEMLTGAALPPAGTTWNEMLADAASAVRRIATIVADLQTFGRPRETVGGADVGAAVAWALRVTAHAFGPRTQVRSEIEGSPHVVLDETRLGQVLVNLLVNAAQALAIDAPHLVTVRARQDGKRVRIEVADDGPGMPPEVRARVFEPFFTTKAPGAGTGLGLSICHGIVRSVGGEITVESQPGRGTVVRVELGLAGPSADTTAPAIDAPPPQARVLVIDDEALVSRLLVRQLAGCEVTAVRGAPEGLAKLEAGAFDVILCDLTMPTMSGAGFYRALADRRPELLPRVVFMSGGAFLPELRAFLEQVRPAVLRKPWTRAELFGAVQRVMDEQGPLR